MTDWRKMSRLADGFSEIAKEKNVVVICAKQAKRSGKGSFLMHNPMPNFVILDNIGILEDGTK